MARPRGALAQPLLDVESRGKVPEVPRAPAPAAGEPAARAARSARREPLLLAAGEFRRASWVPPSGAAAAPTSGPSGATWQHLPTLGSGDEAPISCTLSSPCAEAEGEATAARLDVHPEWRSGARSHSPHFRHSRSPSAGYPGYGSDQDELRHRCHSRGRRSSGRHPLERRTVAPILFSGVQLGHGPVFEQIDFQLGLARKCKAQGCGKTLNRQELEHGTGLCDECYDGMPKACALCHGKLALNQLHMESRLCQKCYSSCEKRCKVCSTDLVNSQLKWGSGLCDACWDRRNYKCKICETDMHETELGYNTGICNECYDGVVKFCRMCNDAIPENQLRYGSGMCNTCYDKFGKQCRECRKELRLGNAHWRSRFCDECFVKAKKECTKCHIAVSDKDRSWATTHLCENCFEKVRSGQCQKCAKVVTGREKHSLTGLCDACYDADTRKCANLTCSNILQFGDKRWGSGLCNLCYDKCEKACMKCNKRIPLLQLSWNSKLCDECYDQMCFCKVCDKKLKLSSLRFGADLEQICEVCHGKQVEDSVARLDTSERGLGAGVWAVIAAQFIFYASPGMLQPSLYLQVQRADYPPSPAAAFAMVLMSAAFSAMIAPVPLGVWADRRGEREVYCGMSALGVLCSFAFVCKLPVALFALCWAGVSMPPAIRGVRAAYFAKKVDPENLSYAGNWASSFGLLGGFSGPLLSVVLNLALGSETVGGLNNFTAGALISALLFAVCLLLVVSFLDPVRKKAPKPRRLDRVGSFTSHGEVCEKCGEEDPWQDLDREERKFVAGLNVVLCQTCRRRRCERCDVEIPHDQLLKQLVNETALCDRCWDDFGEGKSFKRFRREVLLSFCVLSMLLELGMNAAVIAPFQPLAVSEFGWGNNAIAAVNFGGAGLSVVISMTMAYLRLREHIQMSLAVGLYLGGVVISCCPPLSEWRLVVGWMLGIKAQILFMAPFTAIFARLIGGVRFTNSLSTCLCLAPAIGAAIGTSLAPTFVSVAGTPSALLSVLPSAVSVCFVVARWRWLIEGSSTSKALRQRREPDALGREAAGAEEPSGGPTAALLDPEQVGQPP